MFTISQIAKEINGEVIGNSNLTIIGVCDIQEGQNKHISYIDSKEYIPLFDTTKASALIVNKEFKLYREDIVLIKVNKPAKSFIDIVSLFHPKEKTEAFRDKTAIIPSSSSIGDKVTICANVVIEDNVIIGNNVKIGTGSFIGKNSIIGNNTIINPNVTIYNNIEIGNFCSIDSGTVIGADGFGYIKENNSYHKIPHIGKVIIKNNVNIGSSCCIDRGTLSNTIIGEGSKLDNLIHIAHNVKIGKNCAIAGQVGIAGSTIIEDNVILAGQVGIIGHLVIGDGSTVAAKSVVFQSIPSKSFVSGIPARPHKERMRQDVLINQLPNILDRIRNLEK